MRKFMTLAALCALSTGLNAQTAPAPAGAKPVKEKQICRQEDQTGSIMMHRTCHTKEEWVQIDQENARNAHDMLTRSGNGNAATQPPR